jgi:hypothetical protein
MISLISWSHSLARDSFLSLFDSISLYEGCFSFGKLGDTVFSSSCSLVYGEIFEMGAAFDGVFLGWSKK